MSRRAMPWRNQGEAIKVRDTAGLQQALMHVRPGGRVLMEPGDYAGGLHFANVVGAPGKRIVLGATDPARPPRIVGGGTGLHFVAVRHLEIRDLRIEGASDNGINIDDGGTFESPSRDIVLRNLFVSDLPAGNHDGIKLSGVDDFRVEDTTVERWGGSAIDMVGCHRGAIVDCAFRSGGDNAVQCKGGTSELVIRSCRFENPGGRGVNVGGSTGQPFFRPPLATVPAGRRAEARDIRIEGCRFVGGDAPLAFVGVDGAVVRLNTLYHPKRWAMRILQETRTLDFVPCRNVRFEENLVVFRSDAWSEGGVNIGPGTEPKSFRFARNLWYCSDRPDRSRPNLPTTETEGTVGRDPLLRDPDRSDFGVRSGSPALSRGAHAFRE